MPASRVKHMQGQAVAAEKKRHRSESRRGSAFDEEVGVPGAAKKPRAAGARPSEAKRPAAGAGLSPFLSERDHDTKSRKLAKHGKPAHHGFKSAKRYRRR